MARFPFFIAIVLSALLTVIAKAESVQTYQTPTLDLEQINRIGFEGDGFDDSKNKYAWSMASFRGLLFVGTGTPELDPEIPSPGDVWAWNGQRWIPSVRAGFGVPANQGVRGLFVDGEWLYAGTLNTKDGAFLYRSQNGFQWEPVMTDGFGNPKNTAIRAIVRFGDFLYVGTNNNTNGGQVWRSRTGARGTWERVAARDFGKPENFAVGHLAVFENHLYVGTWNQIEGLEIWRSRNGTFFEKVAAGGIDDIANAGVMKFQIFNSKMYVGAMNAQGFTLFVTSNGTNYRRVLSNGFNARGNIYPWQMEVFGGRLYLGTLDVRDMSFDLLSSSDGANWIVETDDAFGPANAGQAGIRSFAVHDGYLHVGTTTLANECQVYRARAR